MLDQVGCKSFRKIKLRNQLISFFLFSMISLSAQAEVILSPVSVVSNSLGEGLVQSPIENVINGSGLVSAFSSGVTQFDSVSTTHMLPINLGWRSQTDILTGSIVFDLGTDYLIEQFALWQNFQLRTSHVASVQVVHHRSIKCGE